MPTTTIYIIYKHCCIITGKSYIGQTSQGIKKRWNEHVFKSTTNSYYHFHNAIRKYGQDNFIHETLFSTDNPDIINEKEIEYIAEYDTYKNGYNMTIGGEGFGSGKNHPFYKKTLSKEHKKKISESSKGKKFSKQTIIKRSISVSGENHFSFCGWYIVPFGKGKYNNAREASTDLISFYSIINWCKNPDIVINKMMIAKSKYLQQLPESPLGKTFRELGFWFESLNILERG